MERINIISGPGGLLSPPFNSGAVLIKGTLYAGSLEGRKLISMATSDWSTANQYIEAASPRGMIFRSGILLSSAFGRNGILVEETLVLTELGAVRAIAPNSDGTKLYLGVAGSNGINEIIVADWSQSARRLLGLGQVTALALNADGSPNLLYAGLSGANGIFEIYASGANIWTVKSIQLAELGQFIGLAYDTDRGHLYAVAVGAAGLYDVDISDFSYVRRLDSLGFLATLAYLPE